MASIFTNPFPQFFSSTPTAYSGGVLRFYASGSSTPLAVYSDENLGSSLGTSVTLNPAGRSDNAIYLQDLAYKVVLEYPSGTPIWTADPVRGRDSAVIAKTLTGSGNPNGAVAGTAGSSGVLPDFYWDFTNSVLYVCTTTGSSSTAVWTAITSASVASLVQAVTPPQGRLTLASGTVASAGTVNGVFYTPAVGNLCPIYNGSQMVPTAFVEVSLSLTAGNHLASTVYDIFMFSNSGTPTLATGPAWTSTSARGAGAGTTQLSRLAGYWVNTVSMTGKNGSSTFTIGANRATYLGSIYIDSVAGQVSCLSAFGQNRKWGLWNAYNRMPITLLVGDATASWTYNVATIRQSRADSGNQGQVFLGLDENSANIIFAQDLTYASGGTTTNPMSIGIGINSTTVYSGKSATVETLSSVAGIAVGRSSAVARHLLLPSLGVTGVACCEFGNATATSCTFNGGSLNMLMSIEYRG